MCKLLLQRHERKSLYRIVRDKKWIHYNNPKSKKSWVKPRHPSASIIKRNIHRYKVILCIWFDQKGMVYYELFKPNETAVCYQEK